MNNCQENFIQMANLFRHTMRRFHYGRKMGQAEFFMLTRIVELTTQKNQWVHGYVPKEDEVYEGISVTEVAAEFDTSMAATSKTLRALEQKGWIHRVVSSKDRRMVYVYITKEGYDMIFAMVSRLESTTRTIAERMGEEDMEQLTKLLAKMHEITLAVLDEEIKNAEG